MRWSETWKNVTAFSSCSDAFDPNHINLGLQFMHFDPSRHPPFTRTVHDTMAQHQPVFFSTCPHVRLSPRIQIMPDTLIRSFDGALLAETCDAGATPVRAYHRTSGNPLAACARHLQVFFAKDASDDPTGVAVQPADDPDRMRDRQGRWTRSRGGRARNSEGFLSLLRADRYLFLATSH